MALNAWANKYNSAKVPPCFQCSVWSFRGWFSGDDNGPALSAPPYSTQHSSIVCISCYICTIVHITRLYTVHIHKGHVLNMFKTSNRIVIGLKISSSKLREIHLKQKTKHLKIKFWTELNVLVACPCGLNIKRSGWSKIESSATASTDNIHRSIENIKCSLEKI